MFKKKITPQTEAEIKDRLAGAFGEVEPVSDVPVREYMTKWLSCFAPDMNVYDAKSFCLPKLLFKNYLWHAFSFQKTDCYMDEDATEAFSQGFEGPCFVLLNGENLLFKVPDGRVFDPENVTAFENIVIFTEDFGETYVHTGNREFGPYYKSRAMAMSDDTEPEVIEPEVVEGEDAE